MIKVHFIATGSLGNACVVSTGDTNILVDCGVSPDKLRKYTDLSDISAVAITHEHIDHAQYALKLCKTLYVPMIASQGTHESLRGDFPDILRLVVHSGQKCRYGDFRLLPFSVYHDAKEPLGYLFGNKRGETFCFISDTGTLSGLKVDADVYAIELNYDDKLLMERYDRGWIAPAHYFRLFRDDGHLSLQAFEDYLENYIPKGRTIILHHAGNIGRINWRKKFPEWEIHQIGKKWPDFKYEFGRAECPF